MVRPVSDSLLPFGRAERTGSYREISHGLHCYRDEQAFWFDLLGRDAENRISTNQLALGTVVKLKEFVLSEWFLRLPGTYWTSDGTRRRIGEAQNRELWDGYTKILTPGGKSELVTGGVGTLRVLPHECEDGDKCRRRKMARD